jgi:hypothetical protein
LSGVGKKGKKGKAEGLPDEERMTESKSALESKQIEVHGMNEKIEEYLTKIREDSCIHAIIQFSNML